MRFKLLSAALAASLSAALTPAPSPASQMGSLVDVQIIDQATGQPAPLHPHGGQLFVAGNAGDRYAVRITNRSAGRVKVVLSVDGINAVSGETASSDQIGYVLLPRQSYDVKGWRKSQDEVAAFYFTSLRDSYAGRTDRPRNVGVIGVATWRERVPRPVAPLVQQPPYRFEIPPPAQAARAAPQASTAAPGGAAADAAEAPRTEPFAGPVPQSTLGSGSAAPSAAPSSSLDSSAAAMARREAAREAAPRTALAEKLGTGHGERVSAHVEYTRFEAEGTAAELVQIFYDSSANLIARGILPEANDARGEPDPFPNRGFVPDPRG